MLASRLKQLSVVFALLFSLLSCDKIEFRNYLGTGANPRQEPESRVVETKLGKPQIWLDTLCSRSFTGRKAGTIGNSLAAKYLFSEVNKMGYAPYYQIFVHSSGDTLRNILIEKKGKTDSLIVIGAHFDGQYESYGDNHYQAANDNGSGVVTLLSILDSLSSVDTLNYTLCCAFWDGEEGSLAPPYKGSSYFVSNVTIKNKVVLYINIDAMGHNHDNTMILGWYGGERVRRMIDILYKEAQFSYMPISRGKGEGSSDYRSFSKEGIPYISYTDKTLNCDYPQHSVDDITDAIDMNRLSRVKEVTIQIINEY